MIAYSLFYTATTACFGASGGRMDSVSGGINEIYYDNINVCSRTSRES